MIIRYEAVLEGKTLGAVRRVTPDHVIPHASSRRVVAYGSRRHFTAVVDAVRWLHEKSAFAGGELEIGGQRVVPRKGRLG